MEEIYYPTEMSTSILNELEVLLNNNQLKEALDQLDAVLSNKNTTLDTKIPYFRVQAGAIYLEIAHRFLWDKNKISEVDKYVSMSFSIFKKHFDEVEEMQFFIKCCFAQGYLLKHDVLYVQDQIKKGNTIMKFDEVDNIYQIKDSLSEGIRSYWEALKICPDVNEEYNIRNNLARALGRTGRYIEAIALFIENTKILPKRWQSHASLGDAISNLAEKAFFPQMASLHFEMIDHYSSALEGDMDNGDRASIEKNLNRHILILKAYGQECSPEILQQNRNEEMEDFQSLSEYRKFVLESGLSLNEHAVFCFCRDSKLDNLKIGTSNGSEHVLANGKFTLLDSLVNRMVSEFSFARKLYYAYTKNVELVKEEDIVFSGLTEIDELGYRIEHLRTSYRLAYSILDKIKNGVCILLDVQNAGVKKAYFENFFDKFSNEFQNSKSLHLTALYSLALDLNRDNGVFKHFKDRRNDMEHGLLIIGNSTGISDGSTVKKEDIEKEAYELLKLTRSALFSFVFLVREHTIVLEKN